MVKGQGGIIKIGNLARCKRTPSNNMKADLLQATVEPLLEYFRQFIPLNEDEKQLVTGLFRPRLYRKRQYVLQEGDVCTQFNFVVRGCLRMYKVDEKGNTHNIQFGTENWWMIDLGSFHSRKPSRLNIEALKDTMVLQIRYWYDMTSSSTAWK